MIYLCVRVASDTLECHNSTTGSAETVHKNCLKNDHDRS
jgi:hypothetical protein